MAYTAEDLVIHIDYFRNVRNKKLAESDWTQLPDSPFTTAEKADWATYRQELRDFPSLFVEGIEDLPRLPLPPGVPDGVDSDN